MMNITGSYTCIAHAQGQIRQPRWGGGGDKNNYNLKIATLII